MIQIKDGWYNPLEIRGILRLDMECFPKYKLELEDGEYGDVYCYGSDILVSPEAYKLFFPFLMKEKNMESIDQAEGWFSEYGDEPEYMAYTVMEFKDFLKKNHASEVLDLDDIQSSMNLYGPNNQVFK